MHTIYLFSSIIILTGEPTHRQGGRDSAPGQGVEGADGGRLVRERQGQNYDDVIQ